MADPENRPLFFWKRDTLDRGEKTVVGAYLNDLARRLRDNPTSEECEAAAQAFDRIVTKGPAAWAACGFIAANRPPQFRRDYEIWVGVRELVVFHDVEPEQAYIRVGTSYTLSASRVKSIYLKLERSWQKSCRGDMG